MVEASSPGELGGMGESADPNAGQGQSPGAPQDGGGAGARGSPGRGETPGRAGRASGPQGLRASGPAQVVPLARRQNVDPLPPLPPALTRVSEPARENGKRSAERAWVPLSLHSDLWR